MLNTSQVRFTATITAIGGSSFTLTPVTGEGDAPAVKITTVVVNTTGAPPNVRSGERVGVLLDALGG